MPTTPVCQHCSKNANIVFLFDEDGPVFVPVIMGNDELVIGVVATKEFPYPVSPFAKTPHFWLCEKCSSQR